MAEMAFLDMGKWQEHALGGTAGSAMNFQSTVFSTLGCVGPILNLRPDSESSQKFAYTPRFSVFLKLSSKNVTVTILAFTSKRV